VFGYTSVSRRQDGLQLATILAIALAILTPAQALLPGFVDKRTALIVGAAGLVVGLASQGLQAVERRRQARASSEAALAALLAAWPLPTARELDPYDLGVGPPRDPAEDLPYIPRDADAELRDRLSAEPFVLVTGPRLAGKTRTAREALVQELPDARMVVPRSAAAFARLVSLDTPTELPGPTVLWLDGLADYLREGGLDGRVLDDAAALKPRMTIVATLSDEERAALLREGGDVARRTRIVLANAAAVALPGVLSAGEHARAAGLYDRPVAGLVGANFAADAGLVPAPPEAPEPPPPPAPEVLASRPRALAPAAARGSRHWRFGLLGAILAALAVAMPVAALPALACGVVVLRRGQTARGVAILATAMVCAMAGVGIVASLPQSPSDPPRLPTPTLTVATVQPGEVELLGSYFAQRGIFDQELQLQWLARFGYPACRNGGGTPQECVARLP
jgi:hypothetical protein